MLPKEKIFNATFQFAPDRIGFRKQLSSILKPSLFTPPSQLWYILVLFLELAAAVAVFIIPEDAYPIVYIRYVLGLIFIFFLPGFAFTKALFPAKHSINSPSEAMLLTERVALSIGLSIVFAMAVGLISYYSPWGIVLTSIVPILVILTAVFATVAVFRERTPSEQSLNE